jgi:Xaa-Pro aminopeptidase
MRRGLMRWDPDELPSDVLAARTARLQAAMRRGGLDACLLYTNLVRPAAVTWLTGFTPYWSEGILLVPADDAPVFATALSKRVASWIRTTLPVGDIVNTPKPGTALGERLAASGAKKVGVLELDAFPSGLCDDLVAAAPAAGLVDASALFAACRRGIDPTERHLLQRADAIAAAALAGIDGGNIKDVAALADAGALAAQVEQRVRLAGAEEIFVAVAADLAAEPRLTRVSRPAPLGDRFALRASVAYKGCWVRRTRTVARDAAGVSAVARGDAWLAQVAQSIEPGTPLSAQIAAHVARLPDARLRRWLAESAIGSYPLQVVAGSATAADATPTDGSFFVLGIELTLGGVPWAAAAPIFVAERESNP